jgi:hypothetical protein
MNTAFVLLAAPGRRPRPGHRGVRRLRRPGFRHLRDRPAFAQLRDRTREIEELKNQF